ncbi:MAG: hypothetical protein HYY24_12925, partial [Verrucomicrobia bacterium]|nr:hypothetical protein [Verrucomicrobiota bacterium]
MIGRVLMGRPRVLILDEPCAGLDPVAREHFLQFLDRLGRRPGASTLILVTYHVEEIVTVFFHVPVLRAGRVLAAGEKASVLNSRKLSQEFGAGLRVRVNGHRYSLSVAPARKVILWFNLQTSGSAGGLAEFDGAGTVCGGWVARVSFPLTPALSR